MKGTERTNGKIGGAMALLTVTAIAAALLLGGVAPAASTGAPAQSLQIELERSLPSGQGAPFYWQVLEAQGYEIEDIDYAKGQRVVFDVAKEGGLYEVYLGLDRRTARVRQVDVKLIDDHGDVFRDDRDRRDDRAGIVSAGARIPVTLDTYLSSEESERGDRFTMTVTETIDEDLPRGTVFEGVVTAVEEAERPRRSGTLVLEARSVRLPDNDTMAVDAAITAEGEEADRGVLEELGDLRDVGIGAAVGAALGGLIKGTKGALIGLIIGGTGTFLATEGEDVELPAGTPLIVELTRDLEVRDER